MDMTGDFTNVKEGSQKPASDTTGGMVMPLESREKESRNLEE